MGLFDGNPVAGGFMGFPSIGGTLYNNQQALKYADRANDMAQANAREDRSWQKMMSDTAHQREVADLKAAGLNPVLSGTGGAGASTPGGSTAETFEAKSGGIVQGGKIDFLGKAQQKLLDAQTGAAQTSSLVNLATAKKVDAETKVLGPKSYLYDKVKQMFESGAKSPEVQFWKEKWQQRHQTIQKMTDPLVNSIVNGSGPEMGGKP